MSDEFKRAPLSEELRIEAALNEHVPTKQRLERMADDAEKLENKCKHAEEIVHYFQPVLETMRPLVLNLERLKRLGQK